MAHAEVDDLEVDEGRGVVWWKAALLAGAVLVMFVVSLRLLERLDEGWQHVAALVVLWTGFTALRERFLPTNRVTALLGLAVVPIGYLGHVLVRIF